MRKKMINHGIAIAVIALFSFLAIASIESTPATTSQYYQTQPQQRHTTSPQTQTIQQPVQPTSTAPTPPPSPRYWTGDGGRGMTIAILEPTGRGLTAEEQWFLPLIQGSITGDFNRYSAMTITDRQNLEKILAEQTQALSGNFSDEDYIRIGHLTNARLILTGSIIKTTNTFMMELSVTDAESGERKASYPPRSVSPSALENLSAIKDASADLLVQLGVALTDTALHVLKSPLDIIVVQGQAVLNQAQVTETQPQTTLTQQQAAQTQQQATVTQQQTTQTQQQNTQNQNQTAQTQAQLAEVQAQIALARGITAQRQGTEVAAMSYFLQAAGFDPSLQEAVSRSNIIAATINSGNIGDDARNDIAWRRRWVERLTETEQHYNNLFSTTSRPYTLFYSTEIIPGPINYQNETQTLSINTNLRGSMTWLISIDQALQAAQAVYDAFKATGRIDTWGLGNWANTGVTNLNPFIERRRDFSIVAELLNSNNMVIGRATFQARGSWAVNIPPRGGVNFYTTYSDDVRQEVRFTGVNVNDITDRLTIRIASVNNVDAQRASQTGVLQIKAMSKEEWNRNIPFTVGKGAIPRRDNLILPRNINSIWDEPVPITLITSGKVQFARLQQNSAHCYSVIVPYAGTLTTFTENSNDTEMWLFNESWTELEYNDDGGTNYNAKISRRVSAGTYYIIVSGLGGGSDSYSLHVSTGR